MVFSRNQNLGPPMKNSCFKHRATLSGKNNNIFRTKHTSELWNSCSHEKTMLNFNFIELWRSLNSNLTTFELLTFWTDTKFDECFKCFVSNANSWKNPSSMTDFICTESQKAQINLFSQTQPMTRTTVIECAIKFLISNVLHCTNMNTDFIDFRK